MENRFPGLGKYQKRIRSVRQLQKEVGKYLGICITICSPRKAQKKTVSLGKDKRGLCWEVLCAGRCCVLGPSQDVARSLSWS